MPKGSIASVEAFADKPVREDFETQEEFDAALAEWEEAQKGPQFDHGDEDAEHGPGVTGWVNPDTVTGPGVEGVKGKYVPEGPGAQK